MNMIYALDLNIKSKQKNTVKAYRNIFSVFRGAFWKFKIIIAYNYSFLYIHLNSILWPSPFNMYMHSWINKCKKRVYSLQQEIIVINMVMGEMYCMYYCTSRTRRLVNTTIHFIITVLFIHVYMLHVRKTVSTYAVECYLGHSS